MTDSHRDPRVPRPDDGFELLLREKLQQLADHAPTTVRSLDEIRVEHHTGRAAMGRAAREGRGRHRRTAGIGATIAALVGAAGFTTIALTGAGTAGAASPEEAVRAFVAATAEEDIFGMIDVIDPTEVPAARSASERGRAEAVDADLVSEGFSLDGLDGLDVSFGQLDLVTESIADDVAVVSVAAGSASWTFDPQAFPLGDQLREAFGEEFAPSNGTSDLLDLVSPAMLATVERDGRWYVSVSYTLAEYARQGADLALPAAPLDPIGSDSPEAAADAFFSGLVSLDLAGAFATAAPGEGDALRRYAPLLVDEAADDIAGWKADGFDLRLSDTSYVVEGDGARRRVVAEGFAIRGTIPEPDVYGFFDPSLPTVIFDYDSMGAAVLDAGVPLPATADGLEFDPQFVFPEGPSNTTSVDENGVVYPLPELPVSDGPNSFEIVRADGCTTWNGDGAVATFGPIDGVIASNGEVLTEVGVVDGGGDDPVDTTSVEASGAAGGVEEVSTFGDAFGYEQLDADSWRSCAPSTPGIGLLALVSTSGLVDLPSLEVVEVDGRWYVSPIGSVAGIVVDLLASVRSAGSLLDSEVAPFVLGTSRASLEMMFVGVEVASLTPECQSLVATDGSMVTGLASDDPDLGLVRACTSGPVYAGEFFPGDTTVPSPVEQVEPAPDEPVAATVPAEVPATSVTP